MTITDIKKIISNDETRQVELKKTTGELKDAMHPYNPLIADVLYKTSYLESWGSGVNRIVEACRKQNIPDPEWSMSGGFVTVTFRRNTQTGGKKDGKKGGEKKLSDRQRVIYDLIKQNDKITVPELARKIMSSDRSVYRDLDSLRRNGVIAREGGRKQGRWVILMEI